ncbi:unnamed protein product [Urochloa decumbens]|uniref:KIB1-4 beta-propeller domain-containing protein n=1 Tax=Urochloa decumbens TaxID=240449 RepID=A0ABC8ZG24_9POAL
MPPPSTTPQCGGGSSSKRRRLKADSWASLSQDLVEQIGWRVLAGDLRDYVRFRAVCTHWNSSTAPPRGRGVTDPRFHPRRWMLLPEGYGLYPGHPNLGGYVRFFNLSTGAFVRVHLPLFDDHVVLDSTDGLLLLLRHPDTAIRLLHPFTGDIAELPPVWPLLPQIKPGISRYLTAEMKVQELDFFLRGVCAAVSVNTAGAIAVMLGIDIKRRVAYATAGDQRWFLSDWELPHLQARTMSFQGKLYATAVNPADKINVYYICRIDPPQPSAEDNHSLTLQPPRMLVKSPLLVGFGNAHLVECGSELMLAGFTDVSLAHLAVYNVSDLIKGKVVPLTDIGDHAIFFEEHGLCVSAKGFPSISGNSIICRRRSFQMVETGINDSWCVQQ